MKINVPEGARDHFWEEPSAGSEEFWAFRFPPRCAIGDKIEFRFDGKIMATAIVSRIEAPGQTECEKTKLYRNRWKVFWKPESFQDLR